MSNSRLTSNFWEFSPPDDILEVDPSLPSNSIPPKTTLAVTGPTQSPVNPMGRIIPTFGTGNQQGGYLGSAIPPYPPPAQALCFTQALSRQDQQAMELILKQAELKDKFLKLHGEWGLKNHLEFLLYQMRQTPMQPIDSIPTFNTDMHNWVVPRSIRDLVREIGHETGYDHFTSLIAVVCIIDICLGGRFKINVKNGWEEPLNLYCLMIAPSGRRKSAFIKPFKKIILKFIEKQQRRYDAEALSDKRNSDFYKAFRKVQGKEIYAEIIKASRLSCGRIDHEKANSLLRSYDEELDRVEGYSSQDKSVFQILIDSFTAKGLIDVMGAQDGYAAILEEEPRFLVDLQKDIDSVIGIFLKAYDGERYSRNSGFRQKVLHHLCMTIFVAIQSEIAGDLYVTSGKKAKRLEAQGFMARFMPIFAGATMGWLGHAHYSIPETRFLKGMIGEPFSFDHFEATLHEMLENFFPYGRKREIRSLSLSKDALKMLEQFSMGNMMLSQCEDYKSMEAFLKKLHGMACRIAGILHIWTKYPDWACEIEADTMALAINIAQTLITHALYAFSPSGLSAIEDAKKVEKWFKEHRYSAFTYRQALQGVYGLDKKRLMPALDALQRANRIAQHPDLDKIRICVVNPQLFT